MIQIGGVPTTFCQEEGILLQKYRDRNGRCIAILFKSIGVRGRFDSPENWRVPNPPGDNPGCKVTIGVPRGLQRRGKAPTS